MAQFFHGTGVILHFETDALRGMYKYGILDEAYFPQISLLWIRNGSLMYSLFDNLLLILRPGHV